MICQTKSELLTFQLWFKVGVFKTHVCNFIFPNKHRELKNKLESLFQIRKTNLGRIKSSPGARSVKIRGLIEKTANSFQTLHSQQFYFFEEVDKIEQKVFLPHISKAKFCRKEKILG